MFLCSPRKTEKVNILENILVLVNSAWSISDFKYLWGPPPYRSDESGGVKKQGIGTFPSRKSGVLSWKGDEVISDWASRYIVIEVIWSFWAWSNVSSWNTHTEPVRSSSLEERGTYVSYLLKSIFQEKGCDVRQSLALLSMILWDALQY